MRSWIIGEPITAFILAGGFGSLATAMGLRNDWIPYLLAVFCFGLLVVIISMWKYTKPVVVALLFASMTLPETKAQAPFPERDAQIEPAGLGVAAGVAVICIGAYCVYKFSKFCSEKFPPKDGGTNRLAAFAASGGQYGDEYGAAYNYGVLGSCAPWEYEFSPAGVDNDGTLYRLNIIVHPYSISQSMTATEGGGQGFQTFQQFQADMLNHGLWISGMPDGSQSFAWNRMTVDPTMSPISFDPVTKTVRNSMSEDGALRRIVVQRSNNLRDWTHFLSTEVGVGAGIQVVDATRQGQMFYRVEMSQP